MSKIKLITIIAILIVLLSACSGGAESTRTFELEEEGVKTTLTYETKGDKVTKQSAENIIEYDLIGMKTKDDAQNYFEPLIQDFKNVDRISHDMDYHDTKVVENMVIDYEVVDFNEVKDLPGMDFEEDAETRGISMKKTAEWLEN